jgi:acyl-CoA thioester hydrolase
MPRMKLDLPAIFDFATELEVRVGDVNYGGHLGHDALLSLVHEARLRFLAGHGFSEKDAGGPGLILADLSVVYRAEAFRGDRLLVEVAARNPGRTGFDLFYRLSKQPASEEVARAKTSMVFFDYGTRRVAAMPGSFLSLFTHQD